MPARKEKLFKQCPLCHQTAVGDPTTRRGFWCSVKVSTCPDCGALFVGSEQNRYRLQSCDPARLGTLRGKKWPRSGCTDCPPMSECYLNRSLSRSDWECIGMGESTDRERAFLGKRSEMEAGELPILSAELSPVALGEGELLHHVCSIYTCEQPLPGEAGEAGTMAITSRRIVLVHEGASFDISLDEIDRLEKAFPGFLVYTKGSTQPFCFFPLRGDPVFYAIQAARINAQDKK